MTKTCSLIVLLFLLFFAPGILAADAPGFDLTATQEEFQSLLPHLSCQRLFHHEQFVARHRPDVEFTWWE